MFKRCIVLLVLCCLLPAIWGTPAEAQDIATLDDLPYLVQSRPDMTLPEALTITIADKHMVFAPASGKDDYRKPVLVVRGASEGHPLTWSSKQKAYLLDYVKEGIDPSAMGAYEFLYTKTLKKDAKISKQLSRRDLLYRFSAASGKCQTIRYTLTLKTKEGEQSYSLIRAADGTYLAQVEGEGLLFNAAGQRMTFPPVTIPGTAEGIPGLPDMDVSDVGYHVPINPDEGFQMKAPGEWTGGYVSVMSQLATITEPLRRDPVTGVYSTQPLSKIKGLVKLINEDILTGVHMRLERPLPEGGTLAVCLSLNLEEVSRELWLIVNGRSIFHDQYGLDATSHVLVERHNRYGVRDLTLKRSEDLLEAVFYDAAGNRQGEQTYAMPPMEWPKGFDTVSRRAFLAQLFPGSKHDTITDLKHLFKQSIQPPTWTPVLHQGEAEWYLAGVPSEMDYVWGSTAERVYSFSRGKTPSIQGDDLDAIRKGTLYELSFTLPTTAEYYIQYTYGLQENMWLNGSIVKYAGRSDYQYELEMDYVAQRWHLTCESARSGHESDLWTADFDIQGKLIPGTVQVLATLLKQEGALQPPDTLADITTHQAVMPDGTPHWEKSDTAWTLAGVPHDATGLWIDGQRVNEDYGRRLEAYASAGQPLLLRGLSLAIMKEMDVEWMYVTCQRGHDTIRYGYNAQEEAWKNQELFLRDTDGALYTVWVNYDDPTVVRVWCQDGSNHMLWKAAYEATGALIPETVEIGQL